MAANVEEIVLHAQQSSVISVYYTRFEGVDPQKGKGDQLPNQWTYRRNQKAADLLSLNRGNQFSNQRVFAIKPPQIKLNQGIDCLVNEGCDKESHDRICSFAKSRIRRGTPWVKSFQRSRASISGQDINNYFHLL
uniref:Uncharacterized protein LOC104241426 n=1 Tax=Nicotiana sylvestris TaxID=4096 RepID=A0A1U7XYG1_NICSY|nr:PREDICTED: uncharacterized protein LOC104241426 [Nicotiana sylvestris]